MRVVEYQNGSGIYRRPLEDPLLYLPRSQVFEFDKNAYIYSPEELRKNLYLVIEGRLKVISRAGVVLDVYQADEFFGEAAFVTETAQGDSAVAMEAVTLMAWSIQEIKELILQRPKLGIALIQMMAKRSDGFGSRLESFAVDSILRRLLRSLLGLSDKLGQQAEDGSVQIIPLTHHFLSQYLGTSREIVTHHMNVLRREGYLQYSRKGIRLEHTACRNKLQQQAASVAV